MAFGASYGRSVRLEILDPFSIVRKDSSKVINAISNDREGNEGKFEDVKGPFVGRDVTRPRGDVFDGSVNIAAEDETYGDPESDEALVQRPNSVESETGRNEVSVKSEPNEDGEEDELEDKSSDNDILTSLLHRSVGAS